MHSLSLYFICTLGINVLSSHRFQLFIHYEMKGHSLLYILFAMLFCACGQQEKQKQQTAESVPTPKEKTENVISREYPCGGDITHLTSVSGAHIIYTQGPNRLIAEGDSALLNYLDTDFDSGVLTISLGSERNPEINLYEGKKQITIYFSAPNLHCVSLCSSGDFTSKGKWCAETVEMGIIGSGSLHCDSIECQAFDFKASGKGSAYFTLIKSNEINFANLGETDVDAITDTDHLVAINKGRSTMTFSGRATTHEFYPSEKGIILFK